MLGSRATYRLMAQPFSARKPASCRSASHVTLLATDGDSMSVKAYTVGHGTRSTEELLEMLRKAKVRTVVDVRRYPSSRRNPQFNQATLASSLADAGIAYRHAEALGGRRSGEPRGERFRRIPNARLLMLL